MPLSGFAASLALPPLVRHGGTGLGFATLGVPASSRPRSAGSCSASERSRVRRERRARCSRSATAGSGASRSAARSCSRRRTACSGSRCSSCTTTAASRPARPRRCSPSCRRSASPAGSAPAAGPTSSAAGSRPLRAIALVVAALLAVTAALVDAPLAVLLPSLVAAGVLAMSWNSLSFAAAVELAGYRRSGAAIGLQQSVLNGSGTLYPPLFGVLVAATLVAVGIPRGRALPARRLARAASIARMSGSSTDSTQIYAIAQHRAGYSPEEDAAHELAAGWMAEAGLEVSRDEVGQSVRQPRGARRSGAARTSTASRPPAGSTAPSASSRRSRRPSGCRSAPLAVVAFRSEESGPAGSRRLDVASRRRTSSCTSSKARCSRGSASRSGS